MPNCVPFVDERRSVKCMGSASLKCQSSPALSLPRASPAQGSSAGFSFPPHSLPPFLTFCSRPMPSRDIPLEETEKTATQAIDQAKARLNLAVCPGAWLMPARMITNSESTVGYDNKLKQAVAGMKLGVDNDVNLDTKKAGLKLIEREASKINVPNSHPSKPI